MEPHEVAHFDVLGRLGEGGMGVVYRARDRVLGREVALKLIRPEHAGDAGARQRFLREAHAAAVLSHPGIATVFEAGEADSAGSGGASVLYIAQELVSGETLAARAKRGALAVDDVVRLGIEVGEALAEAHGHGTVHRDIKPSNLMLTPEGRVKVLDFGLAKQRAWLPGLGSADPEAETLMRTRPGRIVGTPRYMAPEQVTGDPVDARADVFALGCVLYELLAGRPPFAGTSNQEQLRRRLTDTPRPVGEVRAGVPEAVAAVVARALDRDPGQRQADGRELAEGLRAAREAATSIWWPMLNAARRRRATLGAALVLTAAVVGALAWLGVRPEPPAALAFGERDFVLVADVVNRTGEPVFDAVLKSALETDLRQSRYVVVLEAGRVRNTLRMMRLDPDTPIEPEVGRDLCRRSGAKALIVPEIHRAGEAYRLQAALVEPSTSRVVGEVQVTARGREEVLLSAIDDLTRQLRQRLGESLTSIARTDPPFAEYTTSSLEALQMLEAGGLARAAGDHATAERCFREALQHDPRFATARGSLGILLIQFLHQPDEGRRLLTQALEEAGEVSQLEHLNLEALHKQLVTGDLKGALDDYRFIANLYPDHSVAYNNSGRILTALDRLEEAREMFERARRADPQNPTPVWSLWRLSIQRLLDPAEAERLARSLMELLPDNAWAAHALAWSLVTQRRFDEAESVMKTALEIEPRHRVALPNLGHLLLRRGAAEEAVNVYRAALASLRERSVPRDDEHLQLCLGLALQAAGRAEEARRGLLEAEERLRLRGVGESGESDQAMRAALLAAAGREGAARGLLDPLEESEDSPAPLIIKLAQARAVLGDRPRAIEHLERAVAGGYQDPYFILVDPALAAVREDPQVDRLAPRESGLPPTPLPPEAGRQS